MCVDFDGCSCFSIDHRLVLVPMLFQFKTIDVHVERPLAPCPASGKESEVHGFGIMWPYFIPCKMHFMCGTKASWWDVCSSVTTQEMSQDHRVIRYKVYENPAMVASLIETVCDGFLRYRLLNLQWGVGDRPVWGPSNVWYVLATVKLAVGGG